MDELKETAVCHLQKDYLSFMKDDNGFIEYIVNNLSKELADRIMGILEREDEIVIKQSELMVSEYMPTNSVEYRRQIKWNPLVRCKDCEYYYADEKWCRRLGLCGAFDAEGFCSHGERMVEDD